jgi:hypothetical protein
LDHYNLPTDSTPTRGLAEARGDNSQLSHTHSIRRRDGHRHRFRLYSAHATPLLKKISADSQPPNMHMEWFEEGDELAHIRKNTMKSEPLVSYPSSHTSESVKDRYRLTGSVTTIDKR